MFGRKEEREVCEEKSKKYVCRRREMITNEKKAINENEKSGDDDDDGGGGGGQRQRERVRPHQHYITECLQVRGFLSNICLEPEILTCKVTVVCRGMEFQKS